MKELPIIQKARSHGAGLLFEAAAMKQVMEIC